MALTSDQINVLRDSAYAIAQPITEFILKDVARRVAKAGKITDTAAYQIYRAQALGESRKAIKDMLRKQLGITHSEINRLFRDAAKKSYSFDTRGIPWAQPFEQNGSLQQIVSAAAALAKKDFTNLTQTLGLTAPDGKPYPLQKAYQKCMDGAFEQVFTGASDYNTAIRQATHALADKGVRFIDYESGVSTSLEAAVRRNIMGGLGLMDEQIVQADHDMLGCNGWEISAHANSAPDHEDIQGRQYSDADFARLNASLARRIGTLNCGHTAFPIILGVHSPQYTPEQLRRFRDETARGVTYQGRHYTGYEATQKQRALETAIRNQKRRCLVQDAAGDEEKLLLSRVKLGRLREEYARFSNAAGLPMQNERAQVAGFGRIQASKTSWAARKLGMGTSTLKSKDAMRTQLPALTEAERAQLTQYTGFDATAINSAIRHGRINAATREKIAVLDSALAKGTVPNNITLYRETSLSFLEFDNGAQPDKNTIGNFIGQTIPNRIFTSTSFRQLGLPGRDTVIELHVPAGYQGALYIRDLAHPQYKLQDEVLFARGLKYRLLSVDTSGDKVYIKAEVIKP